jgi:hypothetical protein
LIFDRFVQKALDSLSIFAYLCLFYLYLSAGYSGNLNQGHSWFSSSAQRRGDRSYASGFCVCFFGLGGA